MNMIIGESPMIEGTWFNPSTGHIFTVKDTYIEDNRMYVVTTDGQRIDYDMLSKYVKSDNPQRDLKEFAKPQPASAVLPPEVQAAIIPKDNENNFNENDLLSAEDRALIYGSSEGKNNILEKPIQNNLGNIHQPEDEDTLLVRRMLKRSEHPLIDCKISWKGFPTKQMDMLDTMGVDYEKIADFYMKDLDIKDIQAVIKCAIINEIEKHLHDDSEPKDACAGKIEEKKEVKEIQPELKIGEPVQVSKTPSKRVQKRAAVKKATAKKTTKK